MERRLVLTTDRTRLTTWLPDDLEDLHTLHSDPDTMRWIRPGRPETREETRARLASYLEGQGSGAAKWRVETREGAFIGRAGFGTQPGRRALGYTLVRSSWGLGLATEVARALVDWHQAHVDPDGCLPELTAYAVLDNAASRRVLEKAGFVYVDERPHNHMPSALYAWSAASAG